MTPSQDLMKSQYNTFHLNDLSSNNIVSNDKPNNPFSQFNN